MVCGPSSWGRRRGVARALTPPEGSGSAMKTLLAFSVLAAALALAPETPTDTSNPTLRWNRVVTDALAAAQTDPVTESRTLAIVQLAVHDALKASGAAEADAAIATAAHDALLALLPGAKATLDEELGRSLQPLAEGA